MALLPLYSLMLGFIALLGYVALSDKATVASVKKAGGNAQLSVPYLFQHVFPSWFAGVAFGAIIIGALVPAAIMAIAAANLFTTAEPADVPAPAPATVGLGTAGAAGD
jgi:solute:Na+ symporter, SSS family